MLGTMMYIATGILILVPILLIAYIQRSFSYWKRKKVPYLSPSFPFGNFGNPLTNKKPLYIQLQDLYVKLKAERHKYAGIYGSVSPIFCPIDPEYIKYLFVQNPMVSLNRGFYSNEKYQPLSVSIFTTDGEKWRALRAKLTPVFTPGKTKAMLGLMLEVAKTMDKAVEEHVTLKTPLNVKDFVSRYTGNVILSCAFGVEVNNFKDDKLHKLLSSLVSGAISTIRVSFYVNFPNIARFLGVKLYPNKEAKKLCAYIHETVKQRRNKNTIRNDFLQTLIDMEALNTITLTELVSQSLLFYIAGFETSSAALAFILFELANNHDIQEKLRKEVSDTLFKYNGEITYESISEMKYLDMVFSEALRMYAPVPILFRKCNQDIQLPNSDIILEKGTTVLGLGSGLHYDPEYFPNPHKFDPTRFSDPNKINLHAYIPFGSGPRNCLGRNFAKFEVKVATVCLIKRYRLKLNPRMKLPLQLSTAFVPTAKEDILLDVDIIES